MTGDIIYKSLI